MRGVQAWCGVVVSPIARAVYRNTGPRLQSVLAWRERSEQLVQGCVGKATTCEEESVNHYSLVKQ